MMLGYSAKVRMASKRRFRLRGHLCRRPRPLWLKGKTWLLGGMLGIIGSSWGQELPGEGMPSFALPTRTAAMSRAVTPSRRVIVTGGVVAENVELALAAEDALQRVESLLGLEVPFTPMDPIRIALDNASGGESGQVVEAQGWVDRQLVQRIYVSNPEKADQEDLLEALCALAINRFAIFRQTADERASSLARVPAWLSVGIAQNLYPALRSRNADIMAGEWWAGRGPSLAEVVAWQQLPPGRSGEKAAAGLAVGLLLAQSHKDRLMSCVFDRCATGTWSGLDSLKHCDPGGSTEVVWEKEWDVWIASQGERLRVAGETPRELVDKLNSALDIVPLDLGLPEEGSIPLRVSPDELIARRYEPWVRPLATMLGFRIRAFAIGQTQAFGEVAEAYGRYFDELALCSRNGWFRRRLFARRRARTLQSLLNRAREKHGQLEAVFNMEGADRGDAALTDRANEPMRRFVLRQTSSRIPSFEKADSLKVGQPR